MNEQQRQAYLDQINYGRIERVITYKNVQFILEHQNDTLEQLSAYLQSCMEDIGHPPAPGALGQNFFKRRHIFLIRSVRIHRRTSRSEDAASFAASRLNSISHKSRTILRSLNGGGFLMLVILPP